MSKILLCLSLFLAGYLVGQISPAVQAQAPIMGYDNQGGSWQYFSAPGPGGAGQYYGSNGQSGQIYQAPAPLGQRSPC